MTPMDITETWEAVRPNFYDSNGYPVVNRQREDGKEWDKVPDIIISSSLSPRLPYACPCCNEEDNEWPEVTAVDAVTCAGALTEKDTYGSSSESSSGSDDDE